MTKDELKAIRERCELAVHYCDFQKFSRQLLDELARLAAENERLNTDLSNTRQELGKHRESSYEAIRRWAAECKMFREHALKAEDRVTLRQNEVDDMRQKVRELEQQRDAARAALEQLVRWFGRYPEFIPNPDYSQAVEGALKAARAELAKGGA